MGRSDTEEMKLLTADSAPDQVAVLMGDPEKVEHPAQAILGVYNEPPKAFEEIDRKNIPGTVLVTKMHREGCEWAWQPRSNHYETGCGDGFQFMNGGVEENNYNYCPHCGRKIEVVKDD